MPPEQADEIRAWNLRMLPLILSLSVFRKKQDPRGLCKELLQAYRQWFVWVKRRPNRLAPLVNIAHRNYAKASVEASRLAFKLLLQV